ncbi:hypothetical protein [Rubellimicrobium roseum]|uniref:Uncharacterized protein n=1 Tax=Rubellimicrobium roseum TaxID=687525 RepID=A0A5C4NG89_9RHOB|nr:hypothetical protein [Rubellimicrobium roseum]TNC73673.1 hypothetical protein FHG71_04090 [Rubellimicrobium roseum]
MSRLVDRRTVLLALGAAATAAHAGAVSAQPAEINGTIKFQGGAPIPKGEVEISLEGVAIEDGTRHRAADIRVSSDGVSRAMNFSFSPSASSTPLSGTRIVARLERADGWLLARGSARLEADSSISITLSTAMY